MDERVVIRVGKELYRKIRSVAGTYHVNISGIIKQFLESWVEKFETDPELAFMAAWRDGNVQKNRVVDEIVGNVESKLASWIAGKKRGH
jgi:hypothetical protein